MSDRAPAVQLFKIRQVVLHGQDDDRYDEWQQRQLVLDAFAKGYGLTERPRKTARAVQHFSDETTFEVTYEVFGVLLHG